ncbi:MAG: hypothetical protein AB7S72_20005 [Draconibacterium sp.]|nr:hypothetical protein [Prolixibacteraceae bacterium]
MENKKENDNSRLVFAIVLIAIGLLWILRKLGLYFNFHISISELLFPIKSLIHSLPPFIFSWPMILIIVGLILLAGKRSGGVVLIIVGGFFILPKIFVLPGLTISFLIPVILVALGVAMVAKHVNS